MGAHYTSFIFSQRLATTRILYIFDNVASEKQLRPPPFSSLRFFLWFIFVWYFCPLGFNRGGVFNQQEQLVENEHYLSPEWHLLKLTALKVDISRSANHLEEFFVAHVIKLVLCQLNKIGACRQRHPKTVYRVEFIHFDWWVCREHLYCSWVGNFVGVLLFVACEKFSQACFVVLEDKVDFSGPKFFFAENLPRCRYKILL